MNLVAGVMSECLHLRMSQGLGLELALGSGLGDGQRLELQMQWGCQRKVCAASVLPCKLFNLRHAWGWEAQGSQVLWGGLAGQGSVGAARGRCGLVFSPLQTLLPGPWPRALRQVPGVKWLGFLFATYFNRNLAELIKLCISRQMLYTSLNRRRKLSLCVLTYEGRGVFGGFFEKQGQIVTV